MIDPRLLAVNDDATNSDSPLWTAADSSFADLEDIGQAEANLAAMTELETNNVNLEDATEKLRAAWDCVTALPNMPLHLIIKHTTGLLDRTYESSNMTVSHPFDDICNGNIANIIEWGRHFPAVCISCLKPAHRNRCRKKDKDGSPAELIGRMSKHQIALASLECPVRDKTKTRCCLCRTLQPAPDFESHAKDCLQAAITTHGDLPKTFNTWCKRAPIPEGLSFLLCPFVACLDPDLRCQSAADSKPGEEVVSSGRLVPKGSGAALTTGKGTIPAAHRPYAFSAHLASHVFEQKPESSTVRFRTRGERILCGIHGCRWEHHEKTLEGQLTYIVHLVNDHQLEILRNANSSQASRAWTTNLSHASRVRSVEVSDFGGHIPHHDVDQKGRKVYAIVSSEAPRAVKAGKAKKKANKAQFTDAEWELMDRICSDEEV
jgi:hypothetical protein